MTQMSDSHYVPNVVSHANCATRQARSGLARPLHIFATVVAPLFLILFAGCVLPPTLGLEQQDAGINSPPAILSVRSVLEEVTEPGPLTVKMATLGQTLTFRLLDTDLGDTLYVRLFVDYNNPDPTSPRAFCTAPADNKSAQRTCTANLDGLCKTGDVGQPRSLHIGVFDRMLLDSGMPLFMAMPPGGLTTGRNYDLKCQ